jgi:hypothetical protein
MLQWFLQVCCITGTPNDDHNTQLRLKQQLLKSKDGNGNCLSRHSDLESLFLWIKFIMDVASMRRSKRAVIQLDLCILVIANGQIDRYLVLSLCVH